MEQWGITGLMGSGKSEARRYLESLGYPAVDADFAARALLSHRYPQHLEKLKLIFGSEALLDATTVNRAFIRKAISADEKQRLAFESWLHPEIRSFNEKLADEWRAAGKKLSFIEGTRLVESGALKRLAGLILVTTDPSLRKNRLSNRAEMPAHEQAALAKTQDEELMRKHASVIWTNNGDLKDLHRQIDDFLKTHSA